jgi:hypothetical protein
MDQGKTQASQPPQNQGKDQSQGIDQSKQDQTTSQTQQGGQTQTVGQAAPQKKLPTVLVVKVPFTQNGAQSTQGAKVIPMNIPVPRTAQGTVDFDRLSALAIQYERAASAAPLRPNQSDNVAPSAVQKAYQQADRTAPAEARYWHFWYPLGYDGLYGYGYYPYWGPTYGGYYPTYGYYSSGYLYPYYYGNYTPYYDCYYFYYYR